TDPKALPYLLRMVGNPSLQIQNQVEKALHSYIPKSIDGLIEQILQSDVRPNIAQRSAEILKKMHQEVVTPITTRLLPIIPGRTILLVEVLEQLRNPYVIPGLIEVLETPQIEPSLAEVTIRTLCQYQDVRIVQPLRTILTNSTSALTEEAPKKLTEL